MKVNHPLSIYSNRKVYETNYNLNIELVVGVRYVLGQNPISCIIFIPTFEFRALVMLVNICMYLAIHC